MKSSTYDESSGMPATPEKALCGSVSAKRRLPPLPEALQFKPSGGCTCKGPYGPCEACHENELAWKEWMDEPSITPREAMEYARAAMNGGAL
jgi:hypothetical protein